MRNIINVGNGIKMVGKTILVGFTYYTAKNEFIEQKQKWGKIISVDKNNIVIKQVDGEEFSIPNDPRAIKKAKKGEYTLRSTGEIVENPDYLSTWSITQGVTDGEE